MWTLMDPVSVSLAAVAVLYAAQRVVRARAKPSTPLPPGPPGLPLIGNVLDLPTKDEWITYASWGQKWGEMTSVNLLGQPIVILNSARVMELMEKSSIYSDRPRLEMAGQLVGYAKTIVLMPYGQRFRNFRKYFSKVMGTPTAVSKLHGLIESETRKFIQRTLVKPDLVGNLRKSQGAIIMKMAYGIDVKETQDPFVTLIENANDNFSIVTTPGKFMVDVMPFLRHVPAWVPGAGFQTIAKNYAKAFSDMVEVPFTFAKTLIAEGTAPSWSFLYSSLQTDEKLTVEELDDIKHTAASMYGAGADTVVSSQHAFFLAMIQHPEVLKKAQSEIDTVIGNDRLPTMADREHLPYINAMVTEMLRWHNVAPLGVPHCAMEDSIVDGYLIPKGSLIIANLWGMLHDATVYPSPRKFDPSRFIGPNQQRDPRHATFGFGRRICPGLHLAEAALFMTIASSVSVFDIRAAVIDGIVDTPEHENTNGTISHPKPFKYDIKPRSQQALALVASTLE